MLSAGNGFHRAAKGLPEAASAGTQKGPGRLAGPPFAYRLVPVALLCCSLLERASRSEPTPQ